MRRIAFPLMLGFGGVAVLLSLGFWQLQRLEWKEAMLSGIASRLNEAPVSLPERPDQAADQYLAVTASGTFGDGVLRVLSGQKYVGSGYRVISPFTVGTRTILVDRGFIATETAIPAAPAGNVEVTGNLLWPVEADSFTPAPDLKANIWFARDVPAMAAELGTEPVMIVLRDGPPDGAIAPAPVTTEGIPNDHREYAITWFSLAAVWLGMTAFLLWRIRQRMI
ncbi:MAG: SURF1 family protein [Paracoccaceae bacterium]